MFVGQALLRDVLPLSPRLVVVYDGINDFISSETPLVSTHLKRVYDTLLDGRTRFMPNTVTLLRGWFDSGNRLRLWTGTRQNDAVAWKQWARNAKLMHAACQAEGVKYLHVLQPCLGVGKYTVTKYEEKHLIPLLGRNSNYWTLFNDFYEPARKACAEMDFCLDFVDVFAQVATDYRNTNSGLYIDGRHPNGRGNLVIADALAAVLLERELLSIPDDQSAHAD